MRILDEVNHEIGSLVRAARRVAVLSGAGISAESGVPTFREVQTGLWERFSAEDLATGEAFAHDPALVWTWYRWRQSLLLQVEPNPGHSALAGWQRRLREAGGELSIATQNVDDLHERAGAEVLAHLHGSIFAHRCAECSEPAELAAPEYDGLEPPEQPEQPPACACCGSSLRPGVVWFGEMLPLKAFELTSDAIRQADLVVVVGTSGLVQPAASLPLLALERGTPLIEVNPEETEISEVMDYCLRGPSGTMLPAVAESAR
ncbi:SIR2 family NAD-dependent protein deacylase [Nesterenkonia muleiensis]|uniref:SIR2 family NAD-dependent protein deacylase n=1 Tax=Nesterenkonia muleiensis TaxID=2282648 RepID=UPI000E745429|nr:NAD-dependent deacylase [Nesterenkonia muleiensis]